MRKKEEREDNEGCAVGAALGLVFSVFVVSMIIIVVLCLSGCSPKTVYVPVENVRTEYRDRTVEHFMTDTVNNNRVVFIEGDTVIDFRYKEHVRTIHIRDTCVVERCDTIRSPYPVERKLTKWEQTKMDFGGIALGIVAFFVCLVVVWIVRTFYRGR